MKFAPSPLSKNGNKAISKAWFLAKLINKPVAWLKVIALVPKGYCFHGIKSGKLIFSVSEMEVISPEVWAAHRALHG